MNTDFLVVSKRGVEKLISLHEGQQDSFASSGQVEWERIAQYILVLRWK